MFYKIFNLYNLSFFSPKKDQCEDCVAYGLLSAQEKKEKKAEHDEHLRQKDFSRQEKNKDKNESADNVIVCTYDLQAVMSCPQGKASSFYYVSKLGVYNFTIVNLKEDECYCFMWDETQAQRGATEIGTCVLKYLTTLNSTANGPIDVIFYSDNCCGQQKNQYTGQTG